MLIEFFSKHHKLLVVTVILAIIGMWSIVIDIVSVTVQLQHCNIFSSEDTKSMISIICYIFGQ